MGCGCGREVIERGASVYVGKVAVLHTGETIRISEHDPEDARKFAGRNSEGNLIWFKLSDIKRLKQ
jgi:hypothetical protein